MKKLYIGIDLGGTNITFVLTNANGDTLGFTGISTPASSAGIDSGIIDSIYALAAAASCDVSDIQGIGVGSAGSIDKHNGIIITSPNIPCLSGHPLARHIHERTGIRVFLENDATVAVMGEKWMGHGSKFRNWIMLTLGTGVGGGAVIDNKIYTGQNGNAAEFGHTSIDYRGRRCPCGSTGCLELYASATALVRYTRSLLRKYPESSLHARMRSEPLTPIVIEQEAVRGDSLSARAYKDIATWLGIGIANFVNIFNPEAVILGGGMSRAHTLLLPVVKNVVAQRSLKGLYENVRYFMVEDQRTMPALGAAKIAIDALYNNEVV